MGKAFMEAPLVEEDEEAQLHHLCLLEKMGSWRFSVDNGSSEGMSSSTSLLGDVPSDEFNIEDADGGGSSDASSPLGWPLGRSQHTIVHADTRAGHGLFMPSLQQHLPAIGAREAHHGNSSHHLPVERRELPKAKAQMSEVELMKERFAKLLLGEDMSGGAKGVSSALAISNAITNLSASVFGEIWRLEPLSLERKVMWRKEMDWLLSVADYVVELVPSWKSFAAGHDLEVMLSQPRSDLRINLPALRKLDAMLLESLDTFKKVSEFWYVEQDSSSAIMSDHEDSQSMSTPLLLSSRQEDKWWLPSPRVPAAGLSDGTVKHLQHQRECISQILKAALTINNHTLSEMEVPSVYWESLPRNGKTSVGEQVYRQITTHYFSPEAVLCSLDLTTGHITWDLANRIEAAVHVWRRKRQRKAHVRRMLLHWHNLASKGMPHHHYGGHLGYRFDAKASWSLVRDLVLDMDRRDLLAARGESLLIRLRQKFPDLPQSLLDRVKIQYNKDVGQSILESYSRVLESLASNILARIDDVLHVDQVTKRTAP